MRDSIKNFHKQFEWKPVVENASKLSAGGGSAFSSEEGSTFGGGGKKSSKFIVCGMGGSNLAVDLLKIWNPKLDIISHRNYGLPDLDSKILKQNLIITSSYSGNTEETISAFEKAVKKKYSVVVVAVGGRLLKLAKKYKKPYVQLPNMSLQPRMALGLNIKALAALMGDEKMMREINKLAKLLKPYELERIGKALAKRLRGNIPIIYSSERNKGVAYNWKIKFNETGKIPAFYNVFPELNHNEMAGLDVKDSTSELSKNFHFIFLKDVSDNPRVVKRMNVTERLYRERKLPVEVLMLGGKSVFHKMFSSLILADWTSYYIAGEYGVEAEGVPMVEEFKKLIK